MNAYLAVFEKGNSNWSGYVPDLPGVAATGRTLQECKRNMKGAVAFHLEGLAEEHISAPEATAVSEFVKVGK